MILSFLHIFSFLYFLRLSMILLLVESYTISNHIDNKILLHSRTIDVSSNLIHSFHHPSPTKILSEQEQNPSDSKEILLQLWLIHLKGPITEQSKKTVNDCIFPNVLSNYVPHNTFLIPANQDFSKRVRNCPLVLYATPLESEDKIDPLLVTWIRNNPANTLNLLVITLSENAAVHLEQTINEQYQHQNIDLSPSLYHTVSVNAIGKRLHVSYNIQSLISTPYNRILSLFYSVISFISSQKQVVYLTSRKQVALQNYFSHFVHQSGSNLSTPLWDSGIRGEGQILGTGDTGVDSDSCFFRDPLHTVQPNTVMIDHRKIFYYDTTLSGDNRDIYHGHGTHVSGSLCGDSLSINSKFNGMAPKAKLHFVDIQDSNGDLHVPVDMEKHYFPLFYNHGTRIISSSWGLEGGGYEDYSRQSDSFSHKHRNMLLLFAAGNYGVNGHFTVIPPANAKNTLAVGSHHTSWRKNYHYTIPLAIKLSSPDDSDPVYVISAIFGKSWAELIFSGKKVVQAIPYDACQPLQNLPEIAGKIVTVLRGNCSFENKTLNVSPLGTSNPFMMLVVNNDETKPTYMTGTGDPNVYYGMVFQQDGERLKNSHSVSGVSPFLNPDTGDPIAGIDIHSLSTFSSRGPCYDGRTKPDILAVGDSVHSSNSDSSTTSYNCDVVRKTGTSMATPVAAGLAALTRQYYMEGWYPGGVKDIDQSFEPSGSLLKATLINCGQSLHGTIADDTVGMTNVVQNPSIYQGFGRIQLDKVLPINDKNKSSDFQLWIVDEYNTVSDIDSTYQNRKLSTGDVNTFCFNVTNLNNIPFKVTLVYSDPPKVVHINTGNIWYGNSLPLLANSTEPLPRGGNDVLNNVEQVEINDHFFSGDYQVRVRGERIPEGPQNYALVVTGNFTQLNNSVCTSHSALSICPNNCFNNGVCIAGECKCNEWYYGSDCGNEVVLIKLNSSQTVEILPLSWLYFRVDTEFCSKNNTAISFQSRTIDGLGDPDFYFSQDSIPSLLSYEIRDAQCDPCGDFVHQTDIISDEETRFVVMGIYGYCCESSHVTFHVNCSGIIPTKMYFFMKTLVIIMLILLTLVIITGCFILFGTWFKNKHTSFRYSQQLHRDSTQILSDSSIADIMPSSYFANKTLDRNSSSTNLHSSSSIDRPRTHKSRLRNFFLFRPFFPNTNVELEQLVSNNNETNTFFESNTNNTHKNMNSPTDSEFVITTDALDPENNLPDIISDEIDDEGI